MFGGVLKNSCSDHVDVVDQFALWNSIRYIAVASIEYLKSIQMVYKKVVYVANEIG